MKEVINPNYFIYVDGHCVGINIYEQPNILIPDDDDNLEQYIEQVKANDY